MNDAVDVVEDENAEITTTVLCERPACDADCNELSESRIVGKPYSI